MRALVTGANGLIGANLIRELLGAGHAVRAFVRRTSDLRSLEGLPVELAYGDVLEADTLTAAAHGCDILFHTAAVFAYTGRTPSELETIAVAGAQHAVAAAQRAGLRRVVLTSSSVVLGSDTQRAIRDEQQSLTEPDAPPYSVAKAAGERAAFEEAARRGVELIAVCPTISVGPHDYRLGPSNAVILAYLTDPLRLTYPGGCNIVAVRDVARGHLLAATKGQPGRRYVLGSENLEWSAIHQLIAELCGVPGPAVATNHTGAYLAATASEILARLTRQPALTSRTQAKMVGRYYWYSHAQAATLGFAPMSASQALAGAIAWLVTSPHVSRQLRATLRLSRDIYEARAAMVEPIASMGAYQ